MIIENWFLEKNFTQNEKYVYNLGEYEIVEESEMALKVKFISDFGNFMKWIPKSVVNKEVKETINELENVQTTEEAKKIIDSILNSSSNNYENLVNIAKKVGIKVTNRTKVDTIVRKAKEENKFNEIENMVYFNGYYDKWCLNKEA